MFDAVVEHLDDVFLEMRRPREGADDGSALLVVMMAAQAPNVLLIGLATATATLADGALALRFESAPDGLFAFSSGAVIGVALFDLLPEAMELASPAHSALAITTATAGDLTGYFLIDRWQTCFDRNSGIRLGGAGGSRTVPRAKPIISLG